RAVHRTEPGNALLLAKREGPERLLRNLDRSRFAEGRQVEDALRDPGVRVEGVDVRAPRRMLVDAEVPLTARSRRRRGVAPVHDAVLVAVVACLTSMTDPGMSWPDRTSATRTRYFVPSMRSTRKRDSPSSEIAS